MKYEYMSLIRSHLQVMVEHGTDTYGPVHTPMFMATLDPATKRYPEDDTRPEGFRQRAYRLIHAPKGCSAYWDQSLLSAMYAFSGQTGEPLFQAASDRYLDYFMKHCVSEQGLFLWGNHHYYDAFSDRNVWFKGGPPLAEFDRKEQPALHEMRPYLPDWEMMYRINPSAVDRHIRMCAEYHVYDPETGGFNRHSDRKKDYAFIEAGAILVASLAFLYSKTKDSGLLEQALKIAQFSFNHRDRQTNLVINSPTRDRWDSKVTTSEVGLWANLLLRGAAYIAEAGEAGEQRADAVAAVDGDQRGAAIAAELAQMATTALSAYLHYGYDAGKEGYYGRVRLDGTPDLGEKETVYMPDAYSRIWEFLFPTHDYPLQTAMTALALSQAAAPHGEIYRQAAERYAAIVFRDSAAMPSETRYAEHYGRNIVYLAEYARVSGQAEFRTRAEQLAEEAVRSLYRDGMFVGHTGAKWYDAVDGVGFLLLALQYLETGDRSSIACF